MKPPLAFRSPVARAIVMTAGVAALTFSSRVEIPVEPVPFTLQTLAVLLTGALLGWRLGALTVLIWLALGALGLPVFSGGAGGWQRFLGPTAGYLAGFPLAALAMGWLTQQGWNGRKPVHAFVAALIGHAICLIPGALWLSTSVGRHAAIQDGLLPFLPGAILKSLAVAVILMIVTRRR
ncbi:biotin transporter BioY [Allosphingosinicella vermicomposti]|uniref:biotin transporter BioY n=1 Tax=Allosphingosinicella vermicomposti TaxID=614671 RepID=UPI0018F8AD1C|nr:biotin transporter BioY [Allosphingosinicella vermicomposti]